MSTAVWESKSIQAVAPALDDFESVRAVLPGGRMPELDGLRGVAILLVVFWHYVALRFKPTDLGFLAPVWKLLGLSWSGVDLFFVLSGFLIGGILLDNRESKNYFKTFYARRTCRIFPLYYLLVFSYFIAQAMGLGGGSEQIKWLMADPKPFWSYATFTQNFVMVQQGTWGAAWLGITWSLAVEEQFYLVLPLLIRFVPRSKLFPVLLLGVLMAPVIRLAFYYLHPIPLAGGYVLMPSRADALGLGVLAAYAVRSPGVLRTLAESRSRIYGLFGILLAGMVFIAYSSPWFISRPVTFWGRSWIALFYVTLLMIPLLNRNGRIAALFRNPLLQKLGLISYGVYMLHQLVLGLTLASFTGLQSGTTKSLVAALVAFGITLAAAALLYRFVEKPILRIGQKCHY
jgi:peptidoglycan/LPS O-acetylase OafA/YrhL